MKWDVESPKNLDSAVLPSKNDNTGRLMFDLFDKHNKEYNTVELQLALEVGYTITKTYSAYKWKRQRGIFKK